MKLKDYPTYDYNPFRIQSSNMQTFKATKHQVISQDGVLLSEKNDYPLNDIQEHVRIFNYDIFNGLSSSGIMVLSYIFKELSKGGDEVMLNITLIMEAYGLKSKTAAYTGVIDLVDKKIVAKKIGGDVYYINPAMMFKGTRKDWFIKTDKFDYDNNVKTMICE